MWGLKLVAAAAMVAGSTALGLCCAQRLVLRCRALQDTLLLLRLVRVRMQNSHGLWLAELASVASETPFQVLCFAPVITERQSLAQTLGQYLEMAGAPQLLGTAAGGWLQEALECAVTRQETEARMDYFYQMLKEELDAACAQESRDRKLYLQLGPLAGVLLAVILW